MDLPTQTKVRLKRSSPTLSVWLRREVHKTYIARHFLPETHATHGWN